MTAKELFDAGKLRDCIECLTEEIRRSPTDMPRRTFLFELLCFAGELERAERQLDVIGHQDSLAEPAVQVYRNILHAERQRRKVFAVGGQPEFLLEPPAHVLKHLAAVHAVGDGIEGQWQQLTGEAATDRRHIAGTADGKEFDDFRDCDDLVAPVLELFILRDYVWLPFEQVREIELLPPERPRDLLWAPVRLTLVDDRPHRGYMPVLYVNSAAHPDDLVRLGRMTDWIEVGEGPVRGAGQREWLAGDAAIAALDTRSILFA